jgi:hypothetical protein
MRTDGRTEMTKLIFAFCDFANAPKMNSLSGRGLQGECISRHWPLALYKEVTFDVIL